MKKPKTFRFRVSKNPVLFDSPVKPQISKIEPEPLQGAVQGVQASAPEERFAKALEKENIQYIFRYTVGAPKGLPGWKELDFLIQHGGLLYAVEVDTTFTHRDKIYKDVLHDAIILNDQQLSALGTLYPKVIHVDGDTELSDETTAKAYVKQLIGR